MVHRKRGNEKCAFFGRNSRIVIVIWQRNCHRKHSMECNGFRSFRRLFACCKPQKYPLYFLSIEFLLNSFIRKYFVCITFLCFCDIKRWHGIFMWLSTNRPENELVFVEALRSIVFQRRTVVFAGNLLFLWMWRHTKVDSMFESTMWSMRVPKIPNCYHFRNKSVNCMPTYTRNCSKKESNSLLRLQ